MAQTTTIYVHGGASGTNAGTSWANAYTQLQDALDDAESAMTPIVEIVIAEGRYRPRVQPLNPTYERAFIVRNTTNSLATELIIAGGFKGVSGFDTPGSPDGDPRKTILTGEQFVLNLPGQAPIPVERALHVLDLNYSDGDSQETIELMDLVVRDGHAADPTASLSIDGWGGGAIVQTPTEVYFTRVGFFDNYAGASPGSTPAIAGKGGGVWVVANANAAQDLTGSGMGTTGEDSSVRFRQCIFSGNSAHSGGALYLSSGDALSVGNCQFLNNGSITPPNPEDGFITPESEAGGAIYLRPQSEIRINNSLFSDNTAREAGGAIYWEPIFGTAGGGTPSAETTHRIDHCTFSTNSIVSTPGNVNISGAAIHCARGGQAPPLNQQLMLVRNTILWEQSTGDDIVVEGDGVSPERGVTVRLEYSDIESFVNPPSPIPPNISRGVDLSTGTIQLDPRFASVPARNFRLLDGSGGMPLSPCIDTGDKPASTTEFFDWVDVDQDFTFAEPLPRDLDFGARESGVAPDMGCYED